MAGRDDSLWSLAVFNPIFDHCDLIEAVGAFTAGAVRHAGHHEEADPIGAGVVVHVEQRLIELDRGTGCDLLVGPAVIKKELAAAFCKGGEVRVESIDILD